MGGFFVYKVYVDVDYEQHVANKLDIKQDDDDLIFLEKMTSLTSKAITEVEQYPSSIDLNAVGCS